MSMTRNDTLTQLAAGMRKFAGLTAGELLSSDWSGLRGLASADLAYFRKHSDKPVDAVARACHGRSAARIEDPLDA